MMVYGVALLAFCMLVGMYVGDGLGVLLGVKANVGGVGIAMLLLILLSNISDKRFHIKPVSEDGIKFWSAMYIPIVVAMAAKQNVIAAVSGGWMALLAGVLAVVVSFALIPVFTKLSGGQSQPLPPLEK
jgi:malonate transporter MadL subunit